MNSQQKSIIFWIIFIVIVAVIAILIFPKYGTLSKDFRVTYARNLAANLTSSSAANYTQRKFDASKGVPIRNCKDVANITGNLLPTGYEITDKEIPIDTVAICTLSGPGISEIPFSVVGIS